MLRSARLEDVTRDISAAVDELRRGGRRVLLFIDQPDCFLAITGEQVTSQALNDAILSLREVSLPHKPHLYTQNFTGAHRYGRLTISRE